MRIPIPFNIGINWSSLKCGTGGLSLFIYLLFNGIGTSAQYINKQQQGILVKKLAESRSDTVRVQLLISLGEFYTYKEGKTIKDLDSGYKYLIWARKLSDTLKLPYLQHQTESMIVTFLLNKGEIGNAETRYKALIQACERTGDQQCKADAMLRHAIFLGSAGTQIPRAKFEYSVCAKIYHHLNETSQEQRQYLELAFIHFKEGKLDSAEKELLAIIPVAKTLRLAKLPDEYTLLSKLYRVKGDFNNGMKYAILATEAVEASQDKRGERYYYDDLARMYLEIGENRQAQLWFQKAVVKWKALGLPEYGMYLAQGHLIQQLIAQGDSRTALVEVENLNRDIPPVTLIQKACAAQNLALCYNALKQYDLAEQYFVKAIDMYRNSELDFEGPQESYPQIGRFYINRMQFKKAYIYLEQALKFKPQRLSVSAIRDVYYMLFKVDSASKKYLAAIEDQRIAKHLDDSLLNRFKFYELTKLQVQFETSELDIKYRNQEKLNMIKLEQSRQDKNVVIGFSVILSVIFLLLLNQYRIKQSNNRHLRNQQLEISSQNHMLQNLVKEKEWLVKEIHHRVKNNLQTVVSLLESQAIFLKNTDALAAIKNSQHRIHAMSLIHQKLYLTENVTRVNMPTYVRELVDYLSESFGNTQKTIFSLQLSSIELDISTAIPLGLILNEAITNSIKYAFDNKEGLITVGFTEENNFYQLVIADNGRGLPASFRSDAKHNSLGMTLINGLCKELSAKFEIRSENGVTITITFKV